jgi:hypothetical protein
MTATIKDCHCGNCTKYSERPHPAYEGNTICFCGGERTKIETKAVTRAHGCMLHPLAREALMADVVGGLEKKANEEDEKKKESKSNESWMLHAGANSGYLNAISLIRNGVK